MPAAGQFYMLATDELGRPGRAAVSAARVLGRDRRARATTACASTSSSRRSARGPGAWRRSTAGDALHVTGPLGQPVLRALGELAPDAAGAILVGGGIGIAPLALLRRAALASAAFPSGCCSAFATELTRAALELFRCEEVRTASEDGHTGHQGYVTDLLAVMLEGDDAATPPSTPAARRRCWRRCGRCAPSARSRPSWRWRRRWPAASARASAARCRCAVAATSACASTARSCARDEIETALVAGSGH